MSRQESRLKWLIHTPARKAGDRNSKSTCLWMTIMHCSCAVLSQASYFPHQSHKVAHRARATIPTWCKRENLSFLKTKRLVRGHKASEQRSLKVNPGLLTLNPRSCYYACIALDQPVHFSKDSVSSALQYTTSKGPVLLGLYSLCFIQVKKEVQIELKRIL